MAMMRTIFSGRRSSLVTFALSQFASTSSSSSSSFSSKVILEQKGHILKIGLNRPEKKNAFDPEMHIALCDAYGRVATDPSIRVGVLHSTSDTFTGGLDFPVIRPVVANPRKVGTLVAKIADPYGGQFFKPRCPKPIVVALCGPCFTNGMELCMAADVVVADESTRFAQMEICRGIMPFGGALQRFPAISGWQTAMRYILTGDEFDVHEGFRIGLVTEVVPRGKAIDRALEIAEKIATQAAPLATQAVLRNARVARPEPGMSLINSLRQLVDIIRLMSSKDAQEAALAVKEKRNPNFQGK